MKINRKCISALLAMVLTTFSLSSFEQPAQARGWGGHGGWGHYRGGWGGYRGGWGGGWNHHPHYGYGAGLALSAGLGLLGGVLAGRAYGRPYGAPYGYGYNPYYANTYGYGPPVNPYYPQLNTYARVYPY